MSYSPTKLLKLADKFQKLANGISVREASPLERLLAKYSQAANPTGIKDLLGEVWALSSNHGRMLEETAKENGVKPDYVYDTEATDLGDIDETPTPVVNPKDPGYASSTGNPEPTDNYSQKKAPAVGTWTGPRIDPVLQTMLGNNPDGKLGPQTQSSLDHYKLSKGNSAMSNEEAFQLLRGEPEYVSKTKLDWDDNANRYVRTAPTSTSERVALNDVPPNPY